jgi:hypothetical protein
MINFTHSYLVATFTECEKVAVVLRKEETGECNLYRGLSAETASCLGEPIALCDDEKAIIDEIVATALRSSI